MKKWTALLLTLMLTLIASPLSAEEKMSHKEILSTIVEVANENDIPAEIMIAIASKESGANREYFRHYDENGNVIETDDGGIGLMQITEVSDTSYSKTELKDIENNIRAAAEVLNVKWKYIEAGLIPQVQTWKYESGEVSYTEKLNRDVIEHWYFPVMAYNGLAERNIPQSDVEMTYQDAVFQIIEGNGQLFYSDENQGESHVEEISDYMSDLFEEEGSYDVNEENGHVSFTADKVKLETEGTYTRMNNSEAGPLTTFNRNPTSSAIANVYDSKLLNDYTRRGFYNEFSVLDRPLVFSENDAAHYGYYTVEENGAEKFISSSNLISSSHPYATTTFKEFESDKEENEVLTVSDGYVTVELSEVIHDRYVNQRNFYLKDSEGNGLRAEIIEDGTEIQIDPITKVSKEETYTLYVHKVRDEEGNMAEPVKQKVRFE